MRDRSRKGKKSRRFSTAAAAGLIAPRAQQRRRSPPVPASLFSLSLSLPQGNGDQSCLEQLRDAARKPTRFSTPTKLTKMPPSLPSIQCLGALRRLRCFLGPRGMVAAAFFFFGEEKRERNGEREDHARGVVEERSVSKGPRAFEKEKGESERARDSRGDRGKKNFPFSSVFHYYFFRSHSSSLVSLSLSLEKKTRTPPLKQP